MKIYFLHNGLISFVRKDLEILSSNHEVREQCNFEAVTKNLISNLRGVLWSDLVFCWFASLRYLPTAIMAKAAGRKLVIVAGGYDVAKLPEIGYGSMRGGFRTALARLLFSLADRVICFSSSARREAIENAGVPSSKIALIHLGFEPMPEASAEKEPLVVTVGEVSWGNLRRKGLERFVRVATLLPDISFKIVGKLSDESHKYLERISPPNANILGFLDPREFTELLSRAKVYVQASEHEGFGCSVAEAMLHKCIPVVSNVFSLPEVVGGCGRLVDAGDLEALSREITMALRSGPADGYLARERVLAEFPLERRRSLLLAEIESLEN